MEFWFTSFQNIAGFIVLISVVVGIYYYTVHAVKQETFLEEIDEEVAAEKGEKPPATAEPKKKWKEIICAISLVVSFDCFCAE